MNNLFYFLIALGMSPLERLQILDEIDLTSPDGFTELHDKVIEYINENLVLNYTGVKRSLVNELIKSNLNNI